MALHKGHNSDITVKGVAYHVQTEDWGEANPLSYWSFPHACDSLGMELFMPSVIKDWYALSTKDFTILIVLPPLLALCGQLFGGWSSDRMQERRLHACVPIFIGALAMLCTLLEGAFIAVLVGKVVGALALLGGIAELEGEARPQGGVVSVLVHVPAGATAFASWTAPSK